MRQQPVKVTNLKTGEELTYVNGQSLTDNIINAILYTQGRTGQVLDQQVRNKVKNTYTIKETVSTITGRSFAFCQELDLHAKHQ